MTFREPPGNSRRFLFAIKIQTPTTVFCGRGRFLLEKTMTDCEILTLVNRLERCLLSATEFHHRDHITVATVYLYAAEFDSALESMRASLLRFVAHHGGSRYHETMTRFWMMQVEKQIDRSLCLGESVRRVHSALLDKNLVNKYYSSGLLQSPEAKAVWVGPDLGHL
jgi:hypothetical protein